jgi:hypothetical protein
MSGNVVGDEALERPGSIGRIEGLKSVRFVERWRED